MTKLSDLLAIEDEAVKQITLKKMFMPYTEDVCVEGFEKEALTILLNLSSNHQADKCADWLDDARAKNYLSDSKNLKSSLDEIQWFHTHNLKFPDCRVKDSRIIAKPLITSESFISSAALEESWGWSHNSAVYRFTLWLLTPFRWQSQLVNLLSMIKSSNHTWMVLLQDFGLGVEQIADIKELSYIEMPEESFPNRVSEYSKQIRLPRKGHYLTITPVVSHSIQRELEIRSRNKESQLRFISSYLPNPASIGGLCGSLGGYIKILDYSLGIKADSKQTLMRYHQKRSRFFDDYQLTNNKICQTLNRLIGFEPLKTYKQRNASRRIQTKLLRKQIALWMLPLIELRDLQDAEPNQQKMEYQDSLAQAFLAKPELEFTSLVNDFNQRLHLAFQENKFTTKFAYHPKLMQAAKAQIKWVLTQLSKTEQQEDTSHTEQYIYLSSLRVQDAVAMSCPYLSGFPSLTAIWGFVHQYQREFNKRIDSENHVEFSGFSLFVRSEYIQSSAKFSEPNSVATKRTISNVKRPTTLGQRQSDLEMDLVIRVDSKNRLSDFLSELKATFPLVFAGGAVYQPLMSLQIEWLKVFSSKSSLFNRIKGLPANGRWVLPSDEQPNCFDDLEQLLNQGMDNMPISIGFHLLEPPKARENALTEFHAYAENALGIAKRLSPIDVRFAGRDHFFNHAFWSLELTDETILIKNLRD